MNALDLFAGPGGWDEGIRGLGIVPLGIEADEAACQTRAAAGHRTLHADVAELDPQEFAPCELLIGSPPCQAFSTVGKGDGHKDVQVIHTVAEGFRDGRDYRPAYREQLADQRSLLVVEPLRWALALRPRFVALEQVPPVLPLWRQFARILESVGYRAWAGCLSAEQFGVPQTRERAFLIASLDGPVHPPEPTHQAYEPGVPAAVVRVRLRGVGSIDQRRENVRAFLLIAACVVAFAFPAVGVAARSVNGCGDTGCGQTSPPYACNEQTIGWTYWDGSGTWLCTTDWNGNLRWAYLG